MKLYSYWRSTAAYRVRIALNLKQIDYEYKAIHLVKNGGEQLQEDYKAINPQSLVPSLETDDGQVITQSLAIIEYLETISSKNPLYSQNQIKNAQIKSVALSIACDIHPLNNLRVLKYLKGQDWQQQQTDQWYAHWVHQGFTAIEQQLKQNAGKYCFGDEITIADIFLVAQVYNANRFKVTLDDYPIIVGVNQNCLDRKEFINALPENQIDCDL